MIRCFFRIILVFATFVSYILTASAQNMYVRNTNNTQDIYALSSITKLTFSGGNAIMHKTDNNAAVYAINEIRYISFSNFTGIYTPNEQENILTAYPNPVENILNINLPSDKLGGNLHVLGLDGKTLLIQKLTKNQVAIDLNTLPNGIYLCHYIYGTYSETVKIVKQN